MALSWFSRCAAKPRFVNPTHDHTIQIKLATDYPWEDATVLGVCADTGTYKVGVKRLKQPVIVKQNSQDYPL